MEAIKHTLSSMMPAGLCCHHYAEGLGTLWSVVFDLTSGTADTCFGSPQSNRWRTFDLSGQPSVHSYQAELPDEPAGRDLWNDTQI